MNEEAVAYQEALDYLYSFIDYSLTHNFRYTPDKFDLGRVFTFLELLDQPQKKYPVLHVAGTKGKGSTAALMASSLAASGLYKVGLYTSPHLQDFTERIQVGGQRISRAELVELITYLKPFVAQIERLTTFEIMTAVAFLYFARQNVDVAVVEVGLGGRLDATNVVDPLVSVITSLSLDHVHVLGDTLAKIAYEKAGIIKPRRPVVIAPQQEEARQVLIEVTEERGCPLYEVSRDYQYTARDHSLAGQSFDIWPANAESPEIVKLHIPLLGQHQIINAATAYTALRVARQAGLEVPLEAIQKGFRSVNWPARFELLRFDPPLVVDAAHNRESAAQLSQTMADYLPGRPVVLLFGSSEDKDVDGMLAELLPRANWVITTQSVHARAMDAVKLAEMAQKLGGLPIQAIPSVEDALEQALKLAGKDGAIVAAGSLFVAAAVRDVWSRLIHQHDPSQLTVRPI